MGYRATYSFEDINLLTMSSDPADKMPNEGSTEEQNEEEDLIKFDFVKAPTPRLEIFMPIDPEDMHGEISTEETTSDSTIADPMLEQFKDILSEMRINILLEIDGEIQTTNATYREGNKITLLYMSFKELFDDPEKYNEFAKAKPETYEETKELLKDIPGFKFELNEKIFVVFD